MRMESKMDSVIISGGNISSDFALDFLKKKKEKVLYIGILQPKWLDSGLGCGGF